MIKNISSIRSIVATRVVAIYVSRSKDLILIGQTEGFHFKLKAKSHNKAIRCWGLPRQPTLKTGVDRKIGFIVGFCLLLGVNNMTFLNS